MIVKIIITIVGVIFWIILLPVTIALFSFTIIPTPFHTAGLAGIGAAVGIIGLLISLWAVISQITTGKGTPVPLFGPQKLIVTGPYRFCRNPMTLGLTLYYTGAGIIINHGIAAALLLAIVLFHMLYDEFFEEKELIRKFGNDYIHYKKTTPFILPKIRLYKK
ncbi:MAG: isoprenylcysteine carboxylmethyltransferase family protein [Spirochaetes bacterium]|nr:isoprenylcysteine carboxylmethyltransferase family protein [Spirochaetota bacterium]NMB65513.1 isoprenylcysteine carboxylmethyltransferase family protein [Spirochaetota bacterium]